MVNAWNGNPYFWLIASKIWTASVILVRYLDEYINRNNEKKQNIRYIITTVIWKERITFNFCTLKTDEIRLSKLKISYFNFIFLTLFLDFFLTWVGESTLENCFWLGLIWLEFFNKIPELIVELSWRILDVLVPVEINGNEEFIIGSPNISNEQVQEYLDRLNEFYETKMYQLYEKIDEETGNIIGEFTPKKDEKIIRIVPISPTEIKTKSIINKEDIETKYRIVTYNPNKPNKKGND